MRSFITSSVLLAAVASATSFGSSYKGSYDASKPGVTIHNRCGYKLWAWSVKRESGCPSVDPTTVIEPGSSYSENYRDDSVSIKLSGTDSCDPQNITQIEYMHETKKPGFNGNYVDVSYVNCQSKNCPSRRSGFWYKLGNQPDASGEIPIKMKMDANQNCPIWSCKGLSSDDQDDCLDKAYVKHNDDLATRFCALEANWEVYLCDPAGPSGSGSGSPAPSSKQDESYAAAPSSKEESKVPASSSTPSPIMDIKAAAVTKAPEPELKELKTKYETVIVTTTVVEEAKAYRARRHIHGHQRHGFHA